VVVLCCLVKVLLVVLVLPEGGLVTPKAVAEDIEQAEIETYDGVLIGGVSSVSDGAETVKE